MRVGQECAHFDISRKYIEEKQQQQQQNRNKTEVHYNLHLSLCSSSSRGVHCTSIIWCGGNNRFRILSIRLDLE